MLRLRLDAELADLTARVEALAAERGLPMPVVPSDERPSGERPSGDRPSGERPGAEREPGPAPEPGAVRG